MTRTELNKLYFEWLCDAVCKPAIKRSYSKMLEQLHSIPFRYYIPMDDNRFEDGVELRYRFGAIINAPDSEVSSYLDDKDCSVLEMLVALCIRTEEHIMDNSIFGNRTSQWFWDIIGNLGLSTMTNDNYDYKYIDICIDRFLDRTYAPNGEGGPFVLHNNQHDLRTVDIWYQMMWYLDEVLIRTQEI